MIRRAKITLILCIVLIVSFFVIRSCEKYVFQLSQVSSQEYQSDSIVIKRDKYYLRNFIWSGVFPLYGGFIPDPHFLFQHPVDVTNYLSSVFNGKNVRYQLIQVNPYFEDHSSELILGIEVDGLPYEYNLEFPSDFNSFVVDEPRSVFLYDKNYVYFAIPYNYKEELLVYKIGYPLSETNIILPFTLIDLSKSKEVTILDFPLTQDQIEILLSHPYSLFYRLYTQFINKDYAYSQFRGEKTEPIHISAYYGSSLNIRSSDLKGIEDEKFKLKVHNSHEFITFSQDIEVASFLDSKKIVINATHENYHDVAFLGESFESSEFIIRTENKSILLDLEYIDRLLRHIDRYKELRHEGLTEKANLKEGKEDRIPIRIEVITKYKDNYSIKRLGMSFYILPSNITPNTEKDFSNGTDYALPDQVTNENYLFVMSFGDFSLKFSNHEVETLEKYLKSIN